MLSTLLADGVIYFPLSSLFQAVVSRTSYVVREVVILTLGPRGVADKMSSKVVPKVSSCRLRWSSPGKAWCSNAASSRNA